MNVVSSVLRRNSWIGNEYFKILQRLWKKTTVAGSQFHVATRRLCADNSFHLIKFSRAMRYQIHNKMFRLFYTFWNLLMSGEFGKEPPKLILVSGDATLSSWWRCWYLWKPEYTKTLFFNLWIYGRKSEFGTLGRAIPSYSWRCRYLGKSEYPGYQLPAYLQQYVNCLIITNIMKKRRTTRTCIMPTFVHRQPTNQRQI